MPPCWKRGHVPLLGTVCCYELTLQPPSNIHLEPTGDFSDHDKNRVVQGPVGISYVL